MSNVIENVHEDVKNMGGHLSAMLAELDSIKDKPRIVLVLSSAFIEDLVNSLCEEHLKNFDLFARLNLSQKLGILVELGLIHEERAKTLNWVRSKRNKVAHSALFKLDNSHMPEWSDSDHKTTDKIFSLCVQIIGCFWNENIEIFREKYL